MFLMNTAQLHTIFLSLGSNLGNRTLNLDNARKAILHAGNTVVAVSGIYETVSWGYESEHLFYNQCIQIKSELDPGDFISLIQQIEQDTGRKRSVKTYLDRVIDIDILFYDDLIIDTADIHIPHPSMQFRKFVLIPLNEIASRIKHPVLNMTISDLLEICKDEGRIRRLPDK